MPKLTQLWRGQVGFPPELGRWLLPLASCRPQSPRASPCPPVCPSYPLRQVSLLPTPLPLRSASSLARPCPVRAPPFPSLSLSCPQVFWSLLARSSPCLELGSWNLLRETSPCSGSAARRPVGQLGSGGFIAQDLSFSIWKKGEMMAALHSGVFHG